jgi:hypothetical protein
METAIATPAALDQLAQALAAAQAEMTNPTKTKTANAGKYIYRYADLAEVIDHVRPVLGKHGLSFTQLTVYGEGRNQLVTRLFHKSGQYLDSTYPLPVSAGAQEMGSAITYARRYSLCAILGIAAEADDDGAKADQAGAGESEAEAKVRDTLFERIGEAGVAQGKVLAWVKAQRLSLAKDLESLPLTAVETLLSRWDEVVAACKPADKPKSEKPAAGDAPDLKSAPEDLSGIDPALAELMRKDDISRLQLKAYYVGKGHLPDTVEPEKLPATYRTKLIQNWAKAVEAMGAMLPF